MTAREQIMRAEGLVLKPYNDIEGNPTIGYGHLLENGISKSVAEKIFREDYLIAEADAKSLFPTTLRKISLGESVWHRLNQPRQAVLVNMAFNLGRSRLKGFRRMIRAAKRGDYDRTADEILDSKAARKLPRRYGKLAEQMRTGHWGKR